MNQEKENRYVSIIKEIFLSKFKRGMREVAFEREDIEKVAAKLGLKLPKNLGDLVYSFRYRTDLPNEINRKPSAMSGSFGPLAGQSTALS
ncbi:MAG: hypothetical protein M1423_03935 [Acidobacteria bacterium]|nr:hypothetical protein [Acidobacteriota bacterium]